jgi:hypothetical protein
MTARISLMTARLRFPEDDIEHEDDHHETQHAVYVAGCPDCDERADRRESLRREQS